MQDTLLDFNTATFGLRPFSQRHDNPIIGISVNIDTQTSRLHEAYINAILNAGGVPLLIPATADGNALQEIVKQLDGLLLSGGSDIDGHYFGEETLPDVTEVDPQRDYYDFLLLKIASDHQLPIFGICRGMQVINIAFGGGLWQDIPSQYPKNPLNHSIITEEKGKVAHQVTITKESVLYDILQKETIGVNSRHHQAIKEIAPDFKISAISTDGVTEAVEAFPSRRIWAVQWHPENMATNGNNKDMQKLFSHFINEAKLFRQAKDIHTQNLTVDSHCDTPMLFEAHTLDIGYRSPIASVDLVKMYEGKLDAVFVVAYIPQNHPANQATQYAIDLLSKMKNQINVNSQHVGQARSFIEADQLKKEGKKAIFLGVENGHALNGNLDNLIQFKELGVTYLTLCHNGSNLICDSAVGPSIHHGLSHFGKQVVQEMNKLGIAIDLSHAAESSFYDTIKISSAPVIASHSSARALCDHPRNLTDEQIRTLAHAGGVIQICLYTNFLVSKGEATIKEVVDHIEHVIEIGGIECVGIGSDFDGGGGFVGCAGANELINITVELLRRGYSESEIVAIWGGNLRRVINTIQSVNQIKS